MLTTQHEIKTLMSLKFLFIYSLRSYMRTPRALARRCYHPNKFHVYAQVQRLSQAPGTALMKVGEAGGREDVVQSIQASQGHCL